MSDDLGDAGQHTRRPQLPKEYRVVGLLLILAALLWGVAHPERNPLWIEVGLAVLAVTTIVVLWRTIWEPAAKDDEP